MLRMMQVAVVAAMGGLMGFFADAPSLSLMSFLSGALILVLLEGLVGWAASRSGEVLEDERVRVLAEKSGYRAFQATLSALGLITIVLYFVPKWTGLSIMPEAWLKPFAATIGMTVAVLLSSYYLAYLYYSRRPLEGR